MWELYVLFTVLKKGGGAHGEMVKEYVTLIIF